MDIIASIETTSDLGNEAVGPTGCLLGLSLRGAGPGERGRGGVPAVQGAVVPEAALAVQTLVGVERLGSGEGCGIQTENKRNIKCTCHCMDAKNQILQ